MTAKTVAPCFTTENLSDLQEALAVRIHGMRQHVEGLELDNRPSELLERRRAHISRLELLSCSLTDLRERERAAIQPGDLRGIRFEPEAERNTSPEIKNQTADDAGARLYLAELGSLAHFPSRIYLDALIRRAQAWVGKLQIRRAEMDRALCIMDECEEDAAGPDGLCERHEGCDPEEDDGAACDADHAYDQDRDDRLTGDL